MFVNIWENYWWSYYILAYVLAVILSILAGIIIYIIAILLEEKFTKMQKIEDDMHNLPKNAIVQFSAPKWITISEMWFLLYQDLDVSNFWWLVYQWKSEGYLDVVEKDGIKYLRQQKSRLWGGAPDFESTIFRMLFRNGREVSFDSVKQILEQYGRDLTLCLISSCVEKWLIKTKKSKFIKFMKGSGKFIFILFLSILYLKCSLDMFSNKDVLILRPLLSILFIRFYACVCRFFETKYKKWIWKFDWRSIELTEKWEKMMNEIKGYKYYLERCEEREITENLSDKKMLRKVIPYAIVLKLNRKILDKLF